jgi:hypothetical protein
MFMNCRSCNRKIPPLMYEILEGFCQQCFEVVLPAINEMRNKNIKNLTEMEPILYRDKGKVFLACYLPQMIVYDFNTNNFRVNFGDSGLKRKGDLVGFAGFYYDAEHYWGTIRLKK